MNDYISRQAAIDALSYGNEFEYIDMTLIDKHEAERQIKSLPSADVRENVHGEWVHRKTWDRYVCNKCSFEQPLSTNFCPNCGADMRGEEDVDNE